MILRVKLIFDPWRTPFMSHHWIQRENKTRWEILPFGSIEQQSSRNWPIKSLSLRYDMHSRWMSGLSCKPMFCHLIAPSTIQARIPSRSESSFSSRLGSFSPSLNWRLNGMSTSRRHIASSLPVITGLWLVRSQILWVGMKVNSSWYNLEKDSAQFRFQIKSFHLYRQVF